MAESKEPYPNAPLAMVALEVRFADLDQLTRHTVDAIRAHVRENLPLLTTMTEDLVELSVGVQGAPSIRRQNFPRYVSRDQATALVVNRKALILQTTAYRTYQEFRDLAYTALRAVAANAAPDGLHRVGLRYIDEVRVPTVTTLPGDWSGWIDAHLLAAADTDFLPANLTARTWQGLVHFDTGSDCSLTLRYGPAEGYAVDPASDTRRHDAPPPGPFFLLDSDCFWTANAEIPVFDADHIVGLCDQLHAPEKALFHAVVTDKLVNDVFAKKREEVRS